MTLNGRYGRFPGFRKDVCGGLKPGCCRLAGSGLYKRGGHGQPGGGGRLCWRLLLAIHLPGAAPKLYWQSDDPASDQRFLLVFSTLCTCLAFHSTVYHPARKRHALGGTFTTLRWQRHVVARSGRLCCFPPGRITHGGQRAKEVFNQRGVGVSM